jgi:hypothetical protein
MYIGTRICGLMRRGSKKFSWDCPFKNEEFNLLNCLNCTKMDIVSVRDSAEFKNKLMGVMVSF